MCDTLTAVPATDAAKLTAPCPVAVTSAVAVAPDGNAASNVDVSTRAAPSVTTGTERAVLTIAGKTYTCAASTTNTKTVPNATNTNVCLATELAVNETHRAAPSTVADASESAAPFAVAEKKVSAPAEKDSGASNANLSATEEPTTSLWLPGIAGAVTPNAALGAHGGDTTGSSSAISTRGARAVSAKGAVVAIVAATYGESTETPPISVGVTARASVSLYAAYVPEATVTDATSTSVASTTPSASVTDAETLAARSARLW